ncbi:MAG: AAA family ATPase, partial [Candidatus Xenobia bacterium]
MSLHNRISAERHRQFIGREAECQLFSQAVQAPVLPFCVLFVYGPSGSGKTTLLHELVYLSREAGCSATYLNLREIEPGRRTMIPALEELLRDD